MTGTDSEASASSVRELEAFRSADPQQLLEDRMARERPEWKGRRPLRLIRALEPQPLIGDALCGLGDVLRDALADRLRALVVLRTCAVLETLGLYAWVAHCDFALRHALSYWDIACVAVGPTALRGRDATVALAVDQLLDDGRIDAVVHEALGDDAIAVKVATGAYRTFITVMQDVEPEPDIAPLAGIETPARARETYAKLASVRVSPDRAGGGVM